MSITVAIIEDSRELLKSFAGLIEETRDLRCVATCIDGETALERLPALRPDVVLMDIKLPGMSGVECVGRLKALLPQTQVMMLTVLEDYEQIFQSLRAGATGYLLKPYVPERLIENIRDLHAGGSPMSNSIARKVVLAFQKLDERIDSTNGLTVREQNILERLARGHLYKEIAADLGLSFHTVRTHVQNIYKKLHVRTKAEAVQHVHKNRSATGESSKSS
ncbi:MAG: response regulator transcription factor [Verrucomicrobiales bacterium]|nr:response regulator transcription factor [Verrucomicrobiales bacterium]